MPSVPRSRRGLFALLLVLAGIAVAGGWTWREIFAAPAPVEPAKVDTIDPETLAILQERIDAARADASSAKAHGSLGLAYEANRFWAEAEASFANAATLDPTEALWGFHRAIARHHQGDIAGAIDRYEELLDDLPDLVALQHRLGGALLADGRTDEALERYERVIELAPDVPEGWTGRAAARLRQEDFEGAADDLERALSLDEGYRSARYLLGMAYRGLGRDEDAKRELRSGLNAKVRYLPDALTSEQRSYAIKHIRGLERVDELLDEGKVEEAKRALQNFMKRRSNDVGVLERLLRAHEAADEPQEAEKVRQRLESLRRLGNQG